MKSTEEQLEYQREYRERIKSDPERLEKLRAARRRNYYLRIRCNEDEMKKRRERAKSRYERIKQDPELHRIFCEQRRLIGKERYRDDEEYRLRVRKANLDRYHLLHPASKRHNIQT